MSGTRDIYTTVVITCMSMVVGCLCDLRATYAYDILVRKAISGPSPKPPQNDSSG